MDENNEIMARINKLETHVSFNKRIDLLDNTYQDYQSSHTKSKMMFTLLISLILIILCVVYYEYFFMDFNLIPSAILLIIPLSMLSLGLMQHMNQLSICMKQVDQEISYIRVERSLEQ